MDRRLTSIALLGALAVACDEGTHVVSTPDSGVQITTPGRDAGQKPQDIIVTDTIIEDFDSTWFVDELSSAEGIVDTNRGVATLPAESFPTIEESNVVMLETRDDFGGVIAAESIILGSDVLGEARDSLELRAADTMRLSGHLKAGEGGITLVAGKAIYLDGLIESQGPVRIRVADPDGEVVVSGRILTLPTMDEVSSPITILTRGRVEITGELRTGDSDNAVSGAIRISSYEDIDIKGFEAILASGASQANEAGHVVLASEANIHVEDHATVTTGRGNRAFLVEPGAMRGGGDIELRAVGSLFIEGNARVDASANTSGRGGSVYALSGDALRVAGSELTAGDGVQGGLIDIEAVTATIGPQAVLRAGNGEEAGGAISASATRRLVIRASVELRGGDTNCGAGGDIALSSGGPITFTGEAIIRAGSGEDPTGRCVTGYRGGDITVEAQEGDEELITRSSFVGFGDPGGELTIALDPEYTRELPDVRVQRIGTLVSRVFDRGDTHRGHTPVVLERRIETPSGTFAKIQLAGSESPLGPFETWLDASEESPELLAPLANARFFRYRVWMQGRALDAPEVDYFSVALTP